VSWVPIYIKGKEGFKQVVVDKLKMDWMIGSTDGEVNLLMFWLRDRDKLRGLKKAIGGKLILKYRMHFITDLDIHLIYEKKRYILFSEAERQFTFNAKEVRNIILKNRSARAVVLDNNNS